jgi:hypothetical protein
MVVYVFWKPGQWAAAVPDNRAISVPRLMFQADRDLPRSCGRGQECFNPFARQDRQHLERQTSCAARNPV